jgi:predicted metal-dependent peptidase
MSTSPSKDNPPSQSIGVPPSLPQNIQAAKVRVYTMFPYLDIALSSLSFIECKNVPELTTMAVDKHWRLYYDATNVAKWSAPEVATVLIHEIWHLLREHHVRAPSALSQAAEAVFKQLPQELQISTNYERIVRLLWNYAADAEINDDLEGPTLPFPVQPVMPAALKCANNLMAEAYYEAQGLPKDLPSQMAKALKEGKIPGMPDSESGSGSDGRPRGYEVGDGQDQRKISREEAKNIAEITAKNIVQYSKTEKGRGTLPAGLCRWAEDQLDPIVNWKNELRATLSNQAVRISGLLDYTYSKANRRQCLHGKMIFPAHCAYQPSVVIAVDTSGSMSDKDIAQGLAEVKAALRCLEGANISFVACDAKAVVTKNVFGLKDINLIGGGGTDMGVALVAMAEMKPDVALLVTDGYTSYPELNPFTSKTNLITLLVSDGAKPPYGKVIHATPKRKSQV